MNYSHVGFVAGINDDHRIILLGGNQGDAVTLSPNSSKLVKSYRYPIGFTPDYNLPKIILKEEVWMFHQRDNNHFYEQIYFIHKHDNIRLYIHAILC